MDKMERIRRQLSLLSLPRKKVRQDPPCRTRYFVACYLPKVSFEPVVLLVATTQGVSQRH